MIFSESNPTNADDVKWSTHRQMREDVAAAHISQNNRQTHTLTRIYDCSESVNWNEWILCSVWHNLLHHLSILSQAPLDVDAIPLYILFLHIYIVNNIIILFCNLFLLVMLQ